MRLADRLLSVIEGEAAEELRKALRRAFKDCGENRTFQIYLQELRRERSTPPASGPRRQPG